MDIGSPESSPNLGLVSHFSVVFPLPYRVLVLLGVGASCWASNLHILHLVGIDTSHILQIRNEKYPNALPSPFLGRPPAGIASYNFTSFASPSSLYPPIYKLLGAYYIWIIGGWALYFLLSGANIDSLDSYKLIPAISFLGVGLAVIIPFNSLLRVQQSYFHQSLARCLFSPRSQPIHFSDIITADILTSFAKVLGDMWLSITILIPGGSLRFAPSSDGLSEVALPVLISLPYAIRFRQCIVEYLGSNGSSPRPLYNAIKYATAFPVILLSAAQRLVVEDIRTAHPEQLQGDNTWHGEYPLFRLWLLAVLVNSGYSFWWDVTNDWGFDLLVPDTWSKRNKEHRAYQLLSPSSNSHSPTSATAEIIVDDTVSPGLTPAHSRKTSNPSSTATSSTSVPFSGPERSPSNYPFGLRDRLLFRVPAIYYLAIIINFILRFTWSLKLSSHLHTVAEVESGVFLMEALELIRRWMWVFFRVEWEAVKKGNEKAAEEIHIGSVPYRDDVGMEMSRLNEGGSSDDGILL